MDAARIIVGEAPKHVRETRIDPRPAWRALSVFGLLFVGAGLIDLSLALYGADLSQPVTRFAAWAGVAGGLPLVTVGAIASLMAAIAANSRRLALSGTALSGALTLGILIFAVKLLGSTSQAFASAPLGDQAGLNQELVRAWVSFIAFGTALAAATVVGVSSIRSASET